MQGRQFWTDDLLRVTHVLHATNHMMHERHATAPHSSSLQEAKYSPKIVTSVELNSPESSRGRGLHQFPSLFGGLESPETLENIPEENTLVRGSHYLSSMKTYGYRCHSCSLRSWRECGTLGCSATQQILFRTVKARMFRYIPIL